MLLDEKLEAFRDKVPVAGTSPIDMEQEQPRWDGPGIVPEVAAADFDADKLRSAMATSGSLIVRGLIDPEFCESYQQVVDEVLSACENPPPEKQANPAPATPFRNPPSALQSLVPAQELQNSRGFHRLSGSAMCVESATVCLQLMDLYERLGLKEILADYLQDTPCLSVKKWVLRRSKLPVNPAGWHQDGAFMGADINSINMWIPLSRCGGDTGAPGMDVIPRRLTDIVQTGSDEAIFSWSVGQDQLAAKQSDFQPVSPVFNPGDAFFFDHFNLHRTQYRESFTALRYAIETWFFSSSNFPKNQIPLAW
jgi:hypothetical protein